MSRVLFVCCADDDDDNDDVVASVVVVVVAAAAATELRMVILSWRRDSVGRSGFGRSKVGLLLLLLVAWVVLVADEEEKGSSKVSTPRICSMAVRRESRSEIWWSVWSCSCWRVAAEVLVASVVLGADVVVVDDDDDTSGLTDDSVCKATSDEAFWYC